MFERCLYFNTNALARKLNARWERAFAEFDLSPSHGYLLRVVLETPGLSQREISEELGLEKSTVARFVGKLEKRRLLSRRISAEDQREKTVMPTAKARALYADLEALGDELYQSMCAVVGKRNVNTFVSTIRDISNRL